ncbi:Fructose-1_6-bisphosphatase 1, partial [Caligus rogercresseyi]
YSVNESYSASWDPRILDFVENKKRGPTPIPQRYVGTFIADFHRTLMYGGIFLYPANKYSPAGKLRLLYECNPAAFLMSQAGGLGSTGRENVLEMKPRTIHDRCPSIWEPFDNNEVHLSSCVENGYLEEIDKGKMVTNINFIRATEF